MVGTPCSAVHHAYTMHACVFLTILRNTADLILPHKVVRMNVDTDHYGLPQSFGKEVTHFTGSLLYYCRRYKVQALISTEHWLAQY